MAGWLNRSRGDKKVVWEGVDEWKISHHVENAYCLNYDWTASQ